MNMLFAHAGHSHDSADILSAIDHCMPIIIGLGGVIVTLVVIIIILLSTWQPKKATKASKK